MVAVTGLTPTAVLVLLPTRRDPRPCSGVRQPYSQSSPLRVRYPPIEHCNGARRAPVLRRAATLSEAAAGQTGLPPVTSCRARGGGAGREQTRCPGSSTRQRAIDG